MWNDLLTLLRNMIEQKNMSLLTSLRYWKDRDFLRTKILSKAKALFVRLTDVSPRSEGDYYTILWLLVSRRLVHRIAVLSGCLCFCYLLWRSPLSDLQRGGDAGRVFSYTSIPLRFYEGDAQIRARSGYIAYRGGVSGGYASGEGTLYDENGAVVYRGGFAGSRFEGEGTLYYDTGQIRYEGTFADNLFEGSGTLYRESGNRLYEGGFRQGLREGSGLLFDESGTQIFAGDFHRDEPVYAQFLGKTPAGAAALYTGERILYQYDSQYLIVMPEIGAACLAVSARDSLWDEAESEAVYVEKDFVVCGTETATDLKRVKELWGQPSFEGNSYLTFPEAVEAERLGKSGAETGIDTGLTTAPVYEELYRVEGYDSGAPVYLTVFERDGITYTFVSEDADGVFFFYLIE